MPDIPIPEDQFVKIKQKYFIVKTFKKKYNNNTKKKKKKKKSQYKKTKQKFEIAQQVKNTTQKKSKNKKKQQYKKTEQKFEITQQVKSNPPKPRTRSPMNRESSAITPISKHTPSENSIKKD